MATRKQAAKKSSGSRSRRASEAPAAVESRGSLRQAHETSDGTVLPKGAQTGAGTATGTAIINAEKEIPQGENRGSKLEIAGGDPKPDSKGGQKPRGMQAEPAIMVVNGSLEPGTVASPSGPVSIAAVESDPERAQERLEEHREKVENETRRTLGAHKRLDEDTVARMGRAELRAVAHDRGYDIGEAGTRVTRAAFLRAQDDDEYAVEEEV